MSEQCELLHVKKSLSPRRLWMRSHGISLIYDDPAECDGNHIAAYRGNLLKAIGTVNIASAKTEDDALHKLAGQLGLSLWYSQPFASESNMTSQDISAMSLSPTLSFTIGV